MPERSSPEGEKIRVEKMMIAKDIKLEFLNSFENGIVEDENFYVFLAQKADLKKEDLSDYQLAY